MEDIKIKVKPKLLKILTYPNEKLRKGAVRVDLNKNLQEIQQLVDLMFYTMNFYKGIGLSAPQVGVSYQVVVIDLKDGIHPPYTMINPEIIKYEGKTETEEGCLSFPGFRGFVERTSKIEVKYHDYDGIERTLETDGLLSICIQHEMEHLVGKLIIDHFSKLKKEMIIKKLKKDGKFNK